MSAWTGAGLISGLQDVDRVVAQVNQIDRGSVDRLARAVHRAAELEPVPDARTLLPIVPELDVAGLPWPGLRRGATVAAVGSTSLIHVLLAGGMRDGAWAAVVGMPWFGALAAQEAGASLERLVLIPDPGPDWPAVVAALIDAVSMIVVHVSGADERTVQSLRSRARERGGVLVPTSAWPGADVVIERTALQWGGLSAGRGRLKRQTARFRTTGRGKATRPTFWELTLPLPSQMNARRIEPVWDLFDPPR